MASRSIATGRVALAATALIAAVVLGLAGCTNAPATPPAPAPNTTAATPTTPSADAALCAAAAEFQTATNQLVGIDAVAVGVNGVKAALQNVGTAAGHLADAAQSGFGPQVAALRQSVTALRSTVDGLQDQSDLACEVRGALGVAQRDPAGRSADRGQRAGGLPGAPLRIAAGECPIGSADDLSPGSESSRRQTHDHGECS